MSLSVRVITPDKTVWDAEAEEVILPSTTGQLGILGGHAPLLTALDTGVMRVRQSKDWSAIALFGGFAEVEDNSVTILVNGAEQGDKLNLDECRTAYEQAQTRSSASQGGEDRQEKLKAEQSLRKTRALFQAAGGMVKV
ncbi:ATP synthase F1 subunit epsilon [Lusitaniella coriacea]|uniref:ATP synthase F1 subunit epsilon n=1 Tax=Lusitaniella coriacea TaxID=1983105 RepID=UPI003CF68671